MQRFATDPVPDADLATGALCSGPRASAPPAAADIRILTGEITRHGRRLACPAAEYALLAFLALSDGAASAETIAAALRPDRSKHAAHTLLRTTVRNARRRVMQAAIEETAEGYRLGAGVRCDVRVAEKLIAIAEAAPSSVDAMALTLHGSFDALRSERYRRVAPLARFEPRLRALGIALARVLVEHERRHRNRAGAVTILERLAASAPAHAATAAYVRETLRTL